MKLYDYLKICDDSMCFDTADNVYDIIITVDGYGFYGKENPDSEYWCQKLGCEILKEVEIEKIFDGAYASMICKWTEFVNNHIELFKDYIDFEDDDDLEYLSLKFIESVFIGYEDESICRSMIKELQQECKQ